MTFFQNFPLVCFFGGVMGGGSKPIFTSEYVYTADERVIASEKIASATHLWHYITRHINAFIASDGIVSPPILTSEYDIRLQTNAFIASEERVLCWSGDVTFLALETNAFRAGHKHVEYVRSNFSHTHTHTHTAIYHRLPNKTYVEMIAIVTTTHLQTQALLRCGDPKGI